jgi:hypothetical protein
MEHPMLVMQLFGRCRRNATSRITVISNGNSRGVGAATVLGRVNDF